MTQQLELPLKPARERARDDAQTLVRFLRGRRDLQNQPAATLQTVLDWKDRRLRAAAEASDGAILSAPGVTGYRLASATPVDEYYRQYRSRYMSQIAEMQRRITAMDRAVHAAGAQ
jgi:hypothetical protein